jgi:hypothetical protein
MESTGIWIGHELFNKAGAFHLKDQQMVVWQKNLAGKGSLERWRYLTTSNSSLKYQCVTDMIAIS